jgi:hypothetical protein
MSDRALEQTSDIVVGSSGSDRHRRGIRLFVHSEGVGGDDGIMTLCLCKSLMNVAAFFFALSKGLLL